MIARTKIHSTITSTGSTYSSSASQWPTWAGGDDHPLSEDRSHRPSEVNATITASIQYCDRVARRVLEHDERAVVRQDQAGDVAEHERADLHVPDAVGRDDRVVDRVVAVPKMSQPSPERVRRQERHRLALVGQQREVVGEHVRERDRDERVARSAARARGAE